MGRVIVLGSLITDLVARAPRLPKAGETVLGEEFATFLGGKGFNQAVAAARQGAEVALIGRVGADDYGDAFFPALAAEGIDASFVSRDPETGTGVSCVLVGRESGQNMIVANPRANFALTVAQIEAAAAALFISSQPAGEALRAEDTALQAVFLAQCETPLDTVRSGLERARRNALRTVLNAAPVPSELIDDALLALVDILIVNESEATALSGVQVGDAASARVAAERLLARGCWQVMVTLGAQGYLWSARRPDSTVAHRAEPGIPVTAVDATAAGDAFCGTLAASLASGQSVEVALRRANAAGALATTRAGALPSLPTDAEVDMLLNSQIS